MTPMSTFTFSHAEAQQEAFAQLEKAGRRVLVVFSHVLLTHSNHNNTIRKGAITQLSQSSSGVAPRRFSHNLTKEVTNSLPDIGRLASIACKKSTNNNSFFTFFTNHN